MSNEIGQCDVDGCTRPCCATHNHEKRHGTSEYGGCKCIKHLHLIKRGGTEMSNGRRNAYLTRIQDPKLRAKCIEAREKRRVNENGSG